MDTHVALFNVCGLDDEPQIKKQDEIWLSREINNFNISIRVKLGTGLVGKMYNYRKTVHDSIFFVCTIRNWSVLRQLLRNIEVQLNPDLFMKEIDIKFSFNTPVDWPKQVVKS